MPKLKMEGSFTFVMNRADCVLTVMEILRDAFTTGNRESKIQPDTYAQAVSAEIPNKQLDPDLYNIVTANMIHRPSGEHNLTAPCMINMCEKFPKSIPTAH